MTLEQLIHLEKLSQLDQTELLLETNFKYPKVTPVAKPPKHHALPLRTIRPQWTWWLILPILGCLYLIVGTGLVLLSLNSAPTKSEHAQIKENRKLISAEGPKKQIVFN